MHLRGYPKYYIKDGKRRAVFYTAEARDLLSLGWKLEKQTVAEKAKPAEAPTPAPEKVEVDIVVEDADSATLPDFEFMTKVELLKYAEERGVELSSSALKSELIEACQKLQ